MFVPASSKLKWGLLAWLLLGLAGCSSSSKGDRQDWQILLEESASLAADAQHFLTLVSGGAAPHNFTHEHVQHLQKQVADLQKDVSRKLTRPERTRLSEIAERLSQQVNQLEKDPATWDLARLREGFAAVQADLQRLSTEAAP